MRRLDRVRAQTRHLAMAENPERGAASVIVAILLVVLLGFSALAVDVGAMYAEKAQLQNGADSAALAVANQCAKGACGNSTATGQLFANSNANDGASGATVTFPSATTVRVVTKARAAGATADGFSLFFARVMGFNTTQIGATAQAKWGAPSSATTLPWTFSECVFKKYLSATQLNEFNSTGTFTGSPTPTHILLRYDQNAPPYLGCGSQNGYMPGGFGWLDTDTGCSTDINVANAEVGSNPGNDLPAACRDLPATIKDSPVLIPVYTSAVQNGQKTTYTLKGFLAFQVTGYKFGGAVESLDPLAPACNGNCRGIQGYFTRYVSLQEGLTTTSGTPNYGGSVVSLTE